MTVKSSAAWSLGQCPKKDTNMENNENTNDGEKDVCQTDTPLKPQFYRVVRAFPPQDNAWTSEPPETQPTFHYFYEHVVRSSGTWDKPEFVHQDVCRMLGIEHHRNAYATLDPEDKGSGVILHSLCGGPQEMATVTESGLYCLILRSRKPEAKAFKRWIVSEVLPSLRKTGTYTMPGRAAMPRLARQRKTNAIDFQATTEADLIAASTGCSRRTVFRYLTYGRRYDDTPPFDDIPALREWYERMRERFVFKNVAPSFLQIGGH